MAGARRPSARLWLRGARRAALPLCLCLAATGPAAAAEHERITGAAYAAPTTRYDHGVLGDEIEYGALVLTFEDGSTRRFTLPDTLVYEDTAPRLADITGDGAPEVIVVESSLTKGARLAVYGPEGRLATTDHIGQSHRWLAPVGAADMDNDGKIEIGYVDRPHLLKTLRLVQLEGDTLRETATLRGVTNHRIGWDTIPGGLRDCGNGPEMILGTADLRAVVAVFWSRDGHLDTRALGPLHRRSDLDAALTCQD
ncbi:FG-GAP repeat domain-containing protein [Pseudooceanicola sp. C21-150M6]|uniref:FG-GAP repeat domain-containing protein n=1 Tax=Pseudooceanicola sp. C21-150M6 TaxID=3434355 RepID=UPI003D7FDA40